VSENHSSNVGESRKTIKCEGVKEVKEREMSGIRNILKYN
jgi:hypothetical protein